MRVGCGVYGGFKGLEFRVWGSGLGLGSRGSFRVESLVYIGAPREHFECWALGRLTLLLLQALGPLGFNLAQHSPTTRPSVERTADEAFLLSDRV